MNKNNPKMKDQVTLFTTMAWILLAVGGVTVGSIAMVTVVFSWRTMKCMMLACITTMIIFSLLVAAIVVGVLPPTWAWTPSKEQQRNIGRRRFVQRNDNTKEYDIIIIGSGIAGLTTAAVLVQLGYQVCVLEAHELAGGGTHEYNIDGKTKWSFPSGLHYVIPHCEQVLQLSMGARRPTVRFPKLGNAQGIYERIRLSRSNSSSTGDLPIRNERQLRAELHRRYPNLKVQLERFESLATQLLTCFPLWVALTALPWCIREPLLKSVMPRVWWDYANRTAKDVLQEIFQDVPESDQEHVHQLCAYLCGLWVDTGCPPHRVSFFMIAAVSLGFPHEGGAYPCGGPKAIARTLVERIEDASSSASRVYCRAPVQNIIFEDGKAAGVKLSEEFCSGVILRARKCVVSACGWRNTYHLVNNNNYTTKDEGKQHQQRAANAFPDISTASLPPQGEGFVMANVGIKGNCMEELELECCNLWTQPAGQGKSIFQGVEDYLADPLGVPVTEIPLMITFPTMKNRLYNENASIEQSKYQTAQILALAKIDWFVEEHLQDGRTTPHWKSPVRRQQYMDIKDAWRERLQEALLTYYPQLTGKIELFDVSTPLTIEHYLPSQGSGSAIGLDVNAENGPSNCCRFTNMDTMKLLDMKTPVKGLWMTGQDTLCCGVPLAQAAGLITAFRIAGPLGAIQVAIRSAWLLLATYGEETLSSAGSWMNNFKSSERYSNVANGKEN